jgi:hypothetical protein
MNNTTTKANAVLNGVLLRLDNVRGAGDGQWSARCPAHDDSNNSLCLSVGDDGRALLCCQAGCANADIISAIGLSLRDLFPSNGESVNVNGNGHHESSRPKIKAVYHYRDESGSLLYDVCRFEPKDFRQRKPKPGGGWVWKLVDVRRVVYRLPELQAEIHTKPLTAPTVFVVEGEKDVDRLRSLGLTATCNAGGASASKTGKSKWLPTYSDSLVGCHLIVIGDNDEAGRTHAQSIAKLSQGKAASVVVLELPDLPEKGDVSDWLDAGHTAEELLSLATATPKWEPKTGSAAVEVDESAITNCADDTALTMAEIIDRIGKRTDGWPRRVDQSLFISDDHGVNWLGAPSALFGWLHTRTAKPIAWHSKKTGLITKEELFAELRRISRKYVAVEELPHEPELPGHFYACETPEPGDGTAVAALLDRFSPATPIDRDLLQAALATPLWGGGGGQRPAFVVTAEAGRGVGKSKVAQIIGHVFGGFLDFSAKDEIGEVKQRLLSPEGLVRRVALLDNVKSLKFSWGEFESLITAPIVSGKRMYVGEAKRPNMLTWFITLNGAALSTDMAQRSVIIKLAIPQRSGTWEAETIAFALDNRQRIIGDLIGFLRNPAAPLERFSRWATWEQAILARLPEPAEAQKVILERQGAVDVEGEDSEMLEEYFEDQLRKLQYDTDRDDVHIPGEVATRWWNWCNNEKQKTGNVTRAIKQLIEEGRTKNLQLNACRSHGRGFRWVGNNVDITTAIKYDLLARLASRSDQKEAQQQFA